jgi:glycerol-3-phosphate dehydrogenase
MSIPSTPGDTRAATCHRLQSERFDLLVVGGGIVGAGVAALAGELGLAVALVDRGDFASATSSASSKLIHGGHAEAIVREHPEVVYAREREWAVTPEDVLRRRTTIALRGLDSLDVRASVAELLADRALHAPTL